MKKLRKLWRKIRIEAAPYKKALILLGILLPVLCIAGIGIPTVNLLLANRTPVTAIWVVNNHQYQKGEQMEPEDFTVTKIHENGRKIKAEKHEFTLSSAELSPVGNKSIVTVTYTDNPDIQCNTEVAIAREKIVAYPVGYPTAKDVMAVLYSNGELSFEGEGDVLICREGEYPWLDMEWADRYPITAVTFEEAVKPTDMNYWFEGLTTLTYVGQIPDSVTTMVRTFSGCESLKNAADWSRCKKLLNITETYSGCIQLETTHPLPEAVRLAAGTFTDCIMLTQTVDCSKADSLTNCAWMYQNCTRLVEASIPKKAEILDGMFLSCINLKEMPEIPNTAESMISTFEGDVSLTNLTAIPKTVENLISAFRRCELMQGTLPIYAKAEEFDGMFDGCCLATRLDLVGTSPYLDLYANTSVEKRITVKGKKPDPALLSLYDLEFQNENE